MAELERTRLEESGLTTGAESRLRRHLLTLVLFALPFALFHWQVPFCTYQTIGNDYTIFPTRQQQELLFSLRMGSFPLFVPGFTGGHSASALTLGQVFHPQSYLAALGPGYWEGHALDWNTFWRLISLGLTHLVLFRLLRRLRATTLLAVVLAGVAVYNQRMLDWFRYGSSLEGYVAFMLSSAAVFWLWIEPRRWLPRVGVVVAGYLLVVSGHPQVMYYGLLGVGLAILLAPWYVATVLGEESPGWRASVSFYIRAGALLGAAILLAMAYIAPFYFDFLGDNTQRVGRGYEWADGYRDTLTGSFSNFFVPLRASVWSSFGGSALFLVAALAPLVLFLRIRIPAVLWAVWGLAALAFLHAQGARTPVHFLVWKYFPLADSFRIAGRVCMLLPLLFLLLLHWMFLTAPVRRRFFGKQREIAPAAVCVAVALLATIGYALLPGSLTRAQPLWTVLVIPAWTDAWILAGGALTLAAALWLFRDAQPSGRGRVFVGGLLCLGILTQLGICFRYGTWIENRVDTPTLAELREEKRERIDFTGDPGNGLYPSAMVGHIERTPAEPFLGKLYEEHVVVKDTAAAYEAMERGRNPWTVLVEEGPVLETDGGIVDLAGSRVELTRSSFNRLTFRVSSKSAAFFGVAYPFSRHWRATIDGDPVPIRRANGAYQAVHVPAGESVVDFRYVSTAALWGTGVSTLMLSLVLAALAIGTLRGPLRAIALAAAVLSGPTLFVLWRASLHGGQSLGTVYSWTAGPRPERRNLAYGRRAWVSSLRGPQYTLVLGGRLAVDGLHGEDTGALTRTEKNPVWCVDLVDAVPIGELVIREGTERLARKSKRDTYEPFNERPLLVQISLDYENWDTVRVLKAAPKGEPLHLVFDDPPRARLVRIVGQDTRLVLDEVEIYRTAR